MNTSIAVLGLPSSGKTTLIDSFDHNKGLFEPKIVIEPVTAAMPDVEDSIASEQRNYQISVEDKEKHFLSITEYPGDLLTKREENANLREVMIQSMMNKSSWIIMIDGAWFQSNEEDEIEKIIRKNYARIVVPLVSAYADAHEGQAPDIMFVASKVSEYLLPYLNEEGKNKFGRIVESAFGGLVSDTMQPLILLSDTSLKTAVVAIESLIYLHYKCDLLLLRTAALYSASAFVNVCLSFPSQFLLSFLNQANDGNVQIHRNPQTNAQPQRSQVQANSWDSVQGQKKTTFSAPEKQNASPRKGSLILKILAVVIILIILIVIIKVVH